MASAEEFSPQGFRIETAASGQLRLVWDRDDGERRVIVLERSQLPTVTRELLNQIKEEDMTTPKVADILSEKEARVAGLGFSPEPDHLRLTVYVELVPDQDQEVEIALRLSKADVINCLASMTEWLEQAGDAR